MQLDEAVVTVLWIRQLGATPSTSRTLWSSNAKTPAIHHRSTTCRHFHKRASDIPKLRNTSRHCDRNCRDDVRTSFADCIVDGFTHRAYALAVTLVHSVRKGQMEARQSLSLPRIWAFPRVIISCKLRHMPLEAILLQEPVRGGSC